jgi:hypothetical protein
MIRRLRFAPWVIVAAIGLVVALGGGVAYAYWTAHGSGSGNATNAGMQAVTVEALIAGDNPASTLIPGGTADVVVRVANSNAYPVHIYSVAGNGAVTADAGHSACTTTGVTFNAPAAPLSPTVTVPASGSTLVHLPGTASMSTASQSACQGATFQIPLTVTVRS